MQREWKWMKEMIMLQHSAIPISQHYLTTVSVSCVMTAQPYEYLPLNKKDLVALPPETLYDRL